MVTTPNFTDGNWQIVSTLHVDGDPNGDILWQNINDQSMVLWQQDGATTTTITDLPSLDNFDALVVGDFDGDGKADQFLRNGSNGADKILLSTTGTIGNTVTVANLGWDFSAAADYNGDGKDDIFSFLDSAGLIQTWQMNGSIVTDTRLIASGYTTGDKLHAVFNGTGFSTFDSLWFDSSANNYNITDYDGGVRTVTGTFAVNAGNQYVNQGDYNGDGDVDFFFRDADGSDVGSIEIVYTNEFNESARLSYEAPTFRGIRFEAGGDFDGDGIFEVIGRNAVGGETFVMNTFGGSSSGETITGSSGNDLIDGNEGYDRVFGGDGDDIIFDSGSTSDSNNDTFFGGDGNDMLDGGIDDDSLFGGNGNDILQGQSGDDVLVGGAGDDLIYSGNGTDILMGDAGDDTLWGGSFGFFHMKGGTGNDVMYGIGDRVLQEGESGDDVMFGSSALDYMMGGSGNDVLIGGLSLDTLWGGSGNDILIGTDQAGSSGTDDTLYGGSGDDYFYLGNDDVNFYTSTNKATIMDFGITTDYVMLNGTSGDYTFFDTGANIEIRDDNNSGDVIALVLNVANTSDVSDRAIYIG